MFIPDSYDMWEAHQRQLEKELEKLPVCAECGERIQDEDAYNFDFGLLCERCVNEHKVSVEDYIE